MGFDLLDGTTVDCTAMSVVSTIGNLVDAKPYDWTVFGA